MLTVAREALPFYSYTYWLGNVLSSIAGIFALVVSLFVVVYGQALALRGPAGGMVSFCLVQPLSVLSS
jgi:hypothetical protein